MRRVAGALSVFAMLTAACTGGTPARPPTQTPSEALRGGTLRVGLADWVHGELFYAGLSGYRWLDPQVDGELEPSVQELFRCCLLRTLLSYNGHTTSEGGADLQPDLATGLPDISDDGLTWTFHIKRGIHYAPPFADTEIKAQDFVRALERALAPVPKARIARLKRQGCDELPYLGTLLFGPYLLPLLEGAQAFAAGRATTISGLSAPDDHTLTIRLTHPAGNLGNLLALGLTAPIPPLPGNPSAPFGAATGHLEGYGRFLVASGPYMIEGSRKLDFSVPPADQEPLTGFVPSTYSKDPRDHCAGQSIERLVRPGSITLVRNPSWDSATDRLRRAYSDRIVLSIEPTPQEAEQLVDQGRLDLVLDPPPTPKQADAYLSDPGRRSRSMTVRSDGLLYLFLNPAVPPFDDVHVRTAVNLAVDKAALERIVARPSLLSLKGVVAAHFGPDSLEVGQLLSFDPYPTPGHRGSVALAMREMKLSSHDSNGDGVCDGRSCRGVLALTKNDSLYGYISQRLAMAREVRRDLLPLGIALKIQFPPLKGNGTHWDYYDYLATHPQAHVGVGIDVRWYKDIPNGAGFFDAIFSNRCLPRRSAPGGGNCADYSLLGASPSQLRRWGYSVTPVPNVDDRIRQCDGEFGAGQAQCWAELDKYLMDEVVPVVPVLFTTETWVWSDRVARFSIDQSTAIPAPALDQIALKPGSK